uniref:G-protein coupled receptors family 1 profile domain-containing protein n=1 Tax=Plectus sambesii TaxID=2011161 RepID=A0A914UZ11_9BILA
MTLAVAPYFGTVERLNRSINTAKLALLRLHRFKAHPMDDFSPPTHITSDYIEIVFLFIVFALGTSLNAVVLFRTIKDYVHNTTSLHQKNVKTGHLLFKIHLMVTNLLVLLSYCPLKIVWLVTYEWHFEDFGCRFINFAWMAAFCLASNMVTSIAIDRAIIFRRLINAQENGRGLMIGGASYMRLVHWLTGGSYVLAFVCSAPQLFLWRQYVFVYDGGEWAQCVSEWQLIDACKQLGCIYQQSSIAAVVSRMTYAVYHTLIVFWLPFIVIIICYSIIISRLVSHSCSRVLLTRETVALSNSINSEHKRRIHVWRGQMRSRIFRTAAAVVLCYSICWLPYNVVTLAAELYRDLVPALADVEFLKWFILINAVTNPLIYACQNEKK